MEYLITESQYNLIVKSNKKYPLVENTRHTIDSIRDEAKKHDSLTDFGKKSYSLYQAYLRRLKRKEIENLFIDSIPYTAEEIALIVKNKKYRFKEDFRIDKTVKTYHNRAVRLGILDKLFPFEKERREEQKRDSIEKAKKAALEYTIRSRMASSVKDGRYHKILSDNGLLDDVFGPVKGFAGETRINDILINMGLKFKPRENIGICHGNSRCFPDFFIRNIPENREIIPNMPTGGIIIENDGEQHFMPKSHFKGDDGFKLTITRDIGKNNYCKENNIKLIRIKDNKSVNLDMEKVIMDCFNSNDMFILVGYQGYPKLGWNDPLYSELNKNKYIEK